MHRAEDNFALRLTELHDIEPRYAFRNDRAIASRDGKCVGDAGFHNVDLRFGQAGFAILLGDRATWGKGLGTKCTRSPLEYAFKHLNLRRVNPKLLGSIGRARHLYEKQGSLVERRRRRSHAGDGEYLDVVEMAPLRYDYRDGAAA